MKYVTYKKIDVCVQKTIKKLTSGEIKVFPLLYITSKFTRDVQ